MRRVVLATAAMLPVVFAAVAASALAPESAEARLSGTSAAVDRILGEGTAAGSDGAFGYYLKRVGGPVLLAENDGMAFDPASAIKTLYLAYAVRQVADGADALTSPTTVYVYPSSRNSGGDAAGPDLCPDVGDETAGDAVDPAPSLHDVLAGMMQDSNNRYTRAVELRYGRSNIQTFASSLGMGSTVLAQILGCGADGGVQNSWTLDDASRLYEAISAGAAVPTGSRQELYGLMLGGDGYDYANVVSSEARALGIPDAAPEFTDGLSTRFKGGAYDICYGGCGSEDVITRDEAGVLTVPFRSRAGIVPTDFVWGSFIAGEQASCPTFDVPGSSSCTAGDQAGAAVDASLPEIFRDAVREGLRSWAALTTLVADRAVLTSGRLRVSARLVTSYGGKTLPGRRITFAVHGRALCRAVTDSRGRASCTGSPPGIRMAHYTASFAGGNGLFAADATGAMPRLPLRRA